MPTVTAPDSVRDAVLARRGDLLELSHSIHAEPELAFQEFRSAAKTRALVAERGFEIADARFSEGQLIMLAPGAEARLRALSNARVMLIGGEPLANRRSDADGENC